MSSSANISTNGKVGTLLFFLALPIALLICWRIRNASGIQIGDDGYITLKVARNIAEGVGFVYNPGEKVLVTTTPLYALVVGSISSLSQTSVLVVSKYLNTILDLINVVLLFALIKRTTGSVGHATLAAFLLALSPESAISSSFLMEVPLVVFFLLSATLALMQGADKIASLLSACMALTRPEGYALLFALLLYLGSRDRKLPVAPIGISILVVGSWLSFATLYFGHPIPQSILAKHKAYLIHESGLTASYLSRHFVKLFVPFFGITLLQAVLGLFAFLVFLFGVQRARNTALVPMFIFMGAFWTVYSYTNQYMFQWYVVPLEPIYITGVVVGLSALSAAIGPVLSRFAAVVWLVALMLPFNAFPWLTGFRFPGQSWLSIAVTNEDRSPVYAHQILGGEQRESLYIEAAHLLRPCVTNSTTVLAPEFGAFGFYSEARIISAIGHTTPRMVELLPSREEALRTGNAIPVEAVKEFQPEYILSYGRFIENTFWQDTWFSDHYVQSRTWEASIWGMRNLYLYRRNDLAECPRAFFS